MAGVGVEDEDEQKALPSPATSHQSPVTIHDLLFTRLLWLLLPACASILLLATTNQLPRAMPAPFLRRGIVFSGVDSDLIMEPWWQSTWFEHQNLRDDRAEAFASLLWVAAIG